MTATSHAGEWLSPGELKENAKAATIGTGDGRIHVIPSLHPYSIKDGETLRISALVTSKLPVKSVMANLGGLATVELKPDAKGGLGLLPQGGFGAMYSAEWKGAGLEEKVYDVKLTITDVLGMSYTDQSLKFSDPAAGLSTPGSPVYPNAGMMRLGAVTFRDDQSPQSAVIDAANGYAYFGTGTFPGRVIKVALGSGANPPTYVGTLVLNDGENGLYTAVIDTANGYAYFGTVGFPASVVKVKLGSGDDVPERIGAVTLETGEDYLFGAAVIDPANGYSYWGTWTQPGRVVKVALGDGDDPPARVGAVTLDAGENDMWSAVIDTANGYAYFGTGEVNPGKVIKIALGSGANPPTRVNALTLNADEERLLSAEIDTTNGYAYFGTNDDPSRIVKVDLGDGASTPTRIGAVTLDAGEDYVQCSGIDVAAGYAWFGTSSAINQPARVIKVALGSGANPPTRVNAVTLDAGEGRLESAVIDPAAGYFYTGALNESGFDSIVKVALGSGANPPTRTNAYVLDEGEKYFYTGGIDPVNGYGYFVGLDAYPNKVVKFSLGSGGALPKRVGALTLDPADGYVYTSIFDAAAGYAWLGTNQNPARIIKIALGAGDDLPMRIGAITLEPGERIDYSVADDIANGYGYFGTNTTPGKVVKVALGAGAALPARVNALTLESGENNLASAVIDPAAGYAWFGTKTTPGRVVKAALGDGASTPTRIGSVTLNSGENNLERAVIDVAGGFAYFGTQTSPAKVIKIALGDGNNPPTRVGTLTLEAGEDDVFAAVIDPAAKYAYFGIYDAPSYVVKVALNDNPSSPPVRVGAIPLEMDEEYVSTAIIDIAAGYAYFGTEDGIGKAIKVALGQNGALKGTKFTMPEDGVVTDVRFYSHTAAGDVRLAIYDDNEPKNLLWESGPVTNAAEETELIVPIGGGTPASLGLSAGDYWAAWQSNSNADVPSYTMGANGDGFYLRQPFGAAPATLAMDAIIETDEQWTEYITYTVPTPTPTPSPTPEFTPTPTMTPIPTPTATPVPVDADMWYLQ